ncbi:MAG: Gfo/Idh/MocA family oxidoreductase [Planctomycetes bacterium]|nr:Gfo/Idh/MocA family oxidoreductase [Planctomycetota bacterium]
MSELKVAVVGAGRLGSIHARVVSDVEGANLIAVVDPTASSRETLAAAHGTRAFASDEELPADLDAAIVATPTRAHHEVTCRLLRRGVSVLVEKPMATNRDEAEEMIARAAEARCVLMVGHSERFNPVIRALDAYRIEPRFVDCQRVSPFSFRSTDIGVVLDMMIHDIDIILHLVRSEVTGVHAVGVPVIGEHEDLASARLAFANGSVANITASRMALKTERTIRLFAKRFYATLDLAQKKGRIIRPGPALESGDFDLEAEMAKGTANPLEFMMRGLVRMEELVVADAEPLHEEDAAFLDAVRRGIAPPVTGEDGLAALVCAQRIIDSLKDHSSF